MGLKLSLALKLWSIFQQNIVLSYWLLYGNLEITCGYGKYWSQTNYIHVFFFHMTCVVRKSTSLSFGNLFKLIFSDYPMNFCFFWHQTCMHSSTFQLMEEVFNMLKSPYFSTPKRVIFSQHASYVYLWSDNHEPSILMVRGDGHKTKEKTRKNVTLTKTWFTQCRL